MRHWRGSRSEIPRSTPIVETFPERSGEMLAAAPTGPLQGSRSRSRTSGRCPGARSASAPPTLLAPIAPGESGPYRALRDAGAVIAGVANMHELGSSSTGSVSVYGPAHNPWDTERCPGGSSSGPALRSRRAGRRGVGADGLGSIRYPAAYCGLTGLKPTFGRSAMDGHHLAGTDDDDRLGADVRATPATAGCSARCSSASELSAGDAAGLRIGVVRGPGLPRTVAPEVRAACEPRSRRWRPKPAARCARSSSPASSLAGVAAVLVGTTESDRLHVAAAAERPQRGARPGQPRR